MHRCNRTQIRLKWKMRRTFIDSWAVMNGIGPYWVQNHAKVESRKQRINSRWVTWKWVRNRKYSTIFCLPRWLNRCKLSNKSHNLVENLVKSLSIRLSWILATAFQPWNKFSLKIIPLLESKEVRRFQVNNHSNKLWGSSKPLKTNKT